MELNSYDEWSPLKEIIVGSAQNYTSHDRELSFELFFHENVKGLEQYGYPRLSPAGESTSATRFPIKQRYVDELNEDVEGLVATLESLSVKVHRPMELPEDAPAVQTLAWKASVVPPLNLRDISVVLGDEIIETPPMIRSRYFETQFLKPIFTEYFRANAKWTVMPRPFMTDASFDLSYHESTKPSPPTEQIHDARTSPYDIGFEMMFDGAQILRLGNDLLVNVSTENHAMACDWLERHLEGRFRIHRAYRLSDSHIDTMLLALRPGLLLARSKEVADYLPDSLKKWDMIVPPPPVENSFPQYDAEDLVLTSPFIDLNVLSVDPETVLVNSACTDLIRTLEKLKFTVVPVQHRHRRLFGGGFHCFTLDTVREGGPEDYLN